MGVIVKLLIIGIDNRNKEESIAWVKQKVCQNTKETWHLINGM